MLEQYSKIGLTNDLNKIRNMSTFMRQNTCLIIPTVLLALANILVTCLSNCKLDRVQFLALYFSPCISSICLPLLTHTIIHHSFTDDLQLQMSAPHDKISELLNSMHSCIDNVKAWASVSMPKLNGNKTELMLFISKRTKHLHNLPTSITIGNAQIPFKQSVKNLGFILDCQLTMKAHVSNIAPTCYFELHHLASIRIFLTSTATITLVSALVTSRIDYCNSLQNSSTHDVTSHLQQIPKYATPVIFFPTKSSNTTTHLKSFYRLPVKVRSTYKIACL